MTKQKILIIIAIFAIIFIMAIPVNFNNNIEKTTVTSLKKKNYKELLSFNGRIKSAESSYIKLNVPVIIEKVYVKNGQRVEKGELLFSITIQDINNKLKEIVNKNYDNLAMLYTFFNSIVNVNEVEKIYKTMQKNYYANESGIISEINISEDSITNPFSNLITISSNDGIFLYIEVMPEDISKIGVGMEVEFKTATNINKLYTAKILQVPNVTEKKIESNKLLTYIQVIADIENKDEFLISGIDSDCKIYTGNSQDLNTIPYTAINQDKVGEFVFKLNGLRTKKVYIKTGLEFGNDTQVLEGVEFSDILIENALNINENQLIKVE